MHGCDPYFPQARSRKSTGRRIIPPRRPSISSRGASIFRTDDAADRTPASASRGPCAAPHRNQRTYDEIRRTRPVRDGPPGRRAPGLRNPDARAGAGHPSRARRARPHRRRQDRHRQDRGLLAPSLDRLGHAKGGQGPLMLVVTPTRELAQQIGEVCGTIAASTHHRILTVVGGLSYEPQISKLKHGVDVLIATPGRLVDFMEQGAARLADVEVLVLDEADRMLDMGFWPAMKRIIGATPKSRQTLLFSATIDRSILGSVGKLLHDPAMVEIAHKGETADNRGAVRHPHAADAQARPAQGPLGRERRRTRHRVRPARAAARTPRAGASNARATPPRPSIPTAARTSVGERSTTSPPARRTSSWRPTCSRAASTWRRSATW